MAGVWPDARLRSPDPIGPTQGRLLCTQLAPHKQVYSHSVIHISVPPTGSPRRWVDVPHAVAGRPSTLTPSISPRLGVVSQHQKLHRYALCGFLGPPSGSTVPTRILRHRVYSIHETFFKSGAFSGLPAVLALRCSPAAAPPYITDTDRRKSGAFSGLPAVSHTIQHPFISFCRSTAGSVRSHLTRCFRYAKV